ncbi:hypothetical protein OAL67_00915 [bacterium]|nr:hypothetical protein [bacterium]
MSELITHREQGIYDELPEPLLKLSQTLDDVMAEIGEEKEDTFFSRTDKKSRSGGSIALLTQGPKYHQYDVTTHLDIAGWAASQPERSIYHFINANELKKFKELLSSTVDTEALQLASVLHDIEKPFKPRRRIDMGHPWDVSTRIQGEIELLSNTDLALVDGVEPIDVSEFRQKFTQLICEGRKDFPESKLNAFNGLLRGTYDTEKVLQYLRAFSEFDVLIIESNKRNIKGVTKIQGQLDEFLAQHSPEEVAVSAYIVLTDKFAQGVPPENKRSENFEEQHQRTTQMCNYLISKIETQD